MNLTVSQLAVFGAVNLVMCVFSSMAGAGAGFVTMPVMLALGLTPAQAVATGKFTGLAATGGSLHGMRSVKITSRKRLYIVMAMALVIGIISPLIIKNLDAELYKVILGSLLLALIPVMIWKKVGLKQAQPTRKQVVAGYICLAGAMALQAVFSGGLGMLVPIVMMSLLGLSALEANVTKRYSQLLLNLLIVVGVLFSHLIVWPIALLGIFTALIGSSVGSRIAIRKGNRFVMIITIFLMFGSGLYLILS